MSTSIAKLEFASLTEFQKEIHKVKLDENGKPIKMDSVHYNDFKHCTWYAHLLVKIPCQLDDDNYCFKANPTFHFLKYSYLVQEFPAIRVKPEKEKQYLICWPHNLAINTIKQARFNIDEDTRASFDTVWLDQYFENLNKPGFRELFNQMVGNVPMLENWTTFLPPYETSLPQPWWYCEDSRNAFPLHYCSKDTSVTHIYEMRKNIGDLLRMAKKVTNRHGEEQWVELKEVDFSVLEGVSKDSTLKKPEMWGCYAYVSDQELELNRKCDSSEKAIYYNDVISCDQHNTLSYGTSAVVDLFCDTPCKSIFWAAENTDSNLIRNYSNYTTNTYNVYAGWNPIHNVTLKYGKTPRINKMKSLHFDRMVPWYHMRSPPTFAGFSSYSIADNCMCVDAEVGTDYSRLQGTHMIFELKNCDPFVRATKFSEDDEYSELDDIDSHSSVSTFGEDEVHIRDPRFRIRVRLLVMKKLIIEKIGEDRFTFLA
jgi:hypothetical protein